MNKEIYELAIHFRPFELEEKVKELIEKGYDPNDILETLREALKYSYQMYLKGVYALPQLSAMVATFHMGYAVLEGRVKPSISKGRILMGTLGSIHYIGKDIIKCFYISEGFDVIDLGENLMAVDFIKGIEKYQPQVVAISIFLLNALGELEKLVKYLEENNLRRKIKVIIGGAAANEAIARKYRVDGWGKDPDSAIKLLYNVMKEVEKDD
jgi:5-methyltetrahydrofolate--homocysteine methyltransferase